MSAREDITNNIFEQLQNMTNPAPGLVSREFFEVSKIAITQFPAILVNSMNEAREDISRIGQGVLDILNAMCVAHR